jgi:histone H3/H4
MADEEDAIPITSPKPATAAKAEPKKPGVPGRYKQRKEKDSGRVVNNSVVRRLARRSCVTRVSAGIRQRTLTVVDKLLDEWVSKVADLAKGLKKKTITEEMMLHVAKVTGNQIYYTNIRLSSF